MFPFLLVFARFFPKWTKNEKFWTKNEKFRTKSEKFWPKNEKFWTKNENFRTKNAVLIPINLDRAPKGGGALAFLEYLAKIDFFGDNIFHTDSSRPEVSEWRKNFSQTFRNNPKSRPRPHLSTWSCSTDDER